MFEYLEASAKDVLDLESNLKSKEYDKKAAKEILVQKLFQLKRLEFFLQGNLETLDKKTTLEALHIHVKQWIDNEISNKDINSEAKKFTDAEKNKIYSIAVGKLSEIYKRIIENKIDNKIDDVEELITFQNNFLGVFGLSFKNEKNEKIKKEYIEKVIPLCIKISQGDNCKHNIEKFATKTVDRYFNILKQRTEQIIESRKMFNSLFSKGIKYTALTAIGTFLTMEVCNNFSLSRAFICYMLGVVPDEKASKMEL